MFYCWGLSADMDCEQRGAQLERRLCNHSGSTGDCPQKNGSPRKDADALRADELHLR